MCTQYFIPLIEVLIQTGTRVLILDGLASTLPATAKLIGFRCVWCLSPSVNEDCCCLDWPCSPLTPPVLPFECLLLSHTNQTKVTLIFLMYSRILTLISNMLILPPLCVDLEPHPGMLRYHSWFGHVYTEC